MKGSYRNPDILCFSHLRWTFVFQRPQHLMVRWARDHRVFFVEEPVLTDGEGKLCVSCCSSGVHYVVPHVSRNLFKEQANAQVRVLLDKFLQENNITHYISWYYTPMALDVSRHLKPLAIVYDCMDELSGFKNADPALKSSEMELMGKADVVFTGGHSLYKSKSPFHHNIHPFPSSVDLKHYLKARADAPVPGDQAAIPLPRLGFFGVIDERLDLGLLATLAGARPQWHIIMIGPIAKIDPATLPRLPNIHYLGQKDYADLPSYLAGWNVALLPFAKNDATKFISPTKTLEYMAGGKPIVSTSIEDVVNPYGLLGLVHLADTPEDFARAIEQALDADTHALHQEADDYLKNISWDKTWLDMKEHVDRILDDQDQDNPTVTPNAVQDHYDYLIVGCGFAGSVMAERLASAGFKVIVCDKRPHVGGNAYDVEDQAGILIHQYGPHIFHTNSDAVYAYLSQFTRWRPYEHKVLSCVDGKLLPIPINLDTINTLYGWNLTSSQLENFFQTIGENRKTIRTSEDVIISKIGRELYEKFFRRYTYKQWGLDPSELDATVIARIPVRTNRDDRYFTDKHQVMPLDGYTALFENLLSHPNITLHLGVDYRELAGKISHAHLIYSGPIDEYFDYCYGRLQYRSLSFKFETHGRPVFQRAAVVNYPNDHAYTRISEFKYLSGQVHPKTSIVYEFPQDEGDPYYPIPRQENNELYRKYHALAEKTSRVHFVGRLATYKYYNMDQVVAQALTLASKLIGAPYSELQRN